MAVARISKGLQKKLYLGNLDALRDWGYAKDYVEGMWLMLQQDTPEDFVLATGKMYSVKDFVEKAFGVVGISIEWRGTAINQVGIDQSNQKILVEVDPKYFRPNEVEQLLGNPAKAESILGWNPRQTSFERLVQLMVEHDVSLLK
jgi:GDPmannose 4,6-dehydratase